MYNNINLRDWLTVSKPLFVKSGNTEIFPLWSRQNRIYVTLILVVLCIFQTCATHAQNLVQNGAFTANAASFTNWPGYIGGSNPAGIMNWTSTLGLNVGVNGAAVGFVGSPFGPTNAGGYTYAFLQRAVSQTNGLVQNLTVSANTVYQLSLEAAARVGNSPFFRVQIGDTSQIYVSSGNVAANSAAFNHYTYTFTTPSTIVGPSTIQLFNLTTNTSTDYTVAFANVVLAAVVPATFTWTNQFGGNASGSWVTQANWTGATLPTTTASSVLFNNLDLTTDSTVTLDGYATIGSLTFSDKNTATASDWILNAGSPVSSTLTLGGANPIINVTNLGSGNAAIINAVIDGSNGFTKTGTSFLQLNAANVYSGGTIMNGSDCRLSVGNNRALGTGLVTLGATAGAGQLWFQACGNRTLTNNFEIRTTRWIIDNTTINGVSAGDLTLNGSVLLNSGASGVRDIYCNANLTLNGSLTVTPAGNPFNKQGGSTLIINGTNTFTGSTTVSAGLLMVNGRIASAGAVTVNSGATLGGTGLVDGVVTVSGGTVSPGANGSGTLKLGGLSANAASTFALSFSAPGASSNGLIRVNGNLTLDGTLNLSDLGGFTYGVYTGMVYSGTFINNGLNIGTVPGGKTVVVDTSTPNVVLLRVLAGQLSPIAGQSLPMDLANPLVLSWLQVPNAVAYDVFLGTVSNTVASATTNTVGIYLGRTNALTFNVANLQPNTTYYWRVDGLAANGAISLGTVFAFTTGSSMVDLMEDTWVASDALNRSLPGPAECGSPRTNRPVGLFYFLWHKYAGGFGSGTNWDCTQWITAHPFTAPHNPWADNPIFQTANAYYWWGQPALGYYDPSDPWVLRRQIALLAHAGVDVLILDYSNGVTYDTQLNALCDMIRRMRWEGFQINLKIAFLTHANSGTTATYLYNTLYGPGKYTDLWFYWQGKPLVLGYVNGSGGSDLVPSSTVQNYFTWRTSWADVGTHQDEWQWIDSNTPQNPGYDTRADFSEQMPVTCGGWANGNIGRSFTNHVQPDYDNHHLANARTQDKGLFFAEQMNYGLKYDPQFLFVTGWNEWIAGSFAAPTYCYTALLADCCPVNGYYFVDEYTEEYSRDIEPMKGGHTDNYYFQMAGMNRLRKGVRPVPIASFPKAINLAGSFAQWTNLSPAYYDGASDTVWRNYASSVSQVGTYTNFTGRNDFTVLRVAREATNFYFMAQCNSNLTTYTGSNWMVLFIDTDQNHLTGWEGYDFAVNLGPRTASTTSLSQNTTTNWNWTTVRSDIAYKVTGNQMMLAIPRSSLGETTDPVTFDFHWADNFQTNDIADFGVDGDSAPDRRFNYRYQTAVGQPVTLLQDNFETGKQSGWAESWTNGSKWTLTAATSYSSNNCAYANIANGTGNSNLDTRLDTSGLDSLRVSFYYKLHNVVDAQNLTVQYFSPTGWVTIREISRDQYYSSGQAWSYDERQDVWLQFVDSRTKAGTNQMFFTSNFAFRINASGVNTSGQSIWVDDFLATGTITPTNHSPVVAAISNRTLIAGQNLIVTNSATDPDVPVQTLTWSSPNAPTNAQLNSASGLFSWRPLMAQSPSTNFISLIATDNGTPNLAATQSFSVFVLRPVAPIITSPNLSNGVFGITVSGDIGPDYGLYASTNLIDWMLLQQTNPPILPFRLVDPMATNFNRRFYYIKLLP